MKGLAEKSQGVYRSSWRNTRRDPSSRRLTDRPSVVSARPTTFSSLWAWGVEQASATCDEPPLRIHDEDRPVPAPTHRSAIIVGWPFSAQFERYTGGSKRSPSPFAIALSRLYNPRRVQSHEWRILAALVSGHTDPEVVRAVILGGPRTDYFEATAIRALSYVWDRAHEELARAVDPPTPAGAA